MSQGYARALAKVVVAQTAESVGFEAVQQSANETLADLLLQYIAEIGSATHSYAELAGRVDCNVNDLLLALQDVGASVDDIMEYSEHMEDVPFAHSIPRFPALKKPAAFVSFSQKGEDPPAHIPSFLPAFPEKHTYVDTPVFTKHAQDAREQKLALEKGRREAEKALLKLSARIQPKEEATLEGKGTGKTSSNAVGNPFLAAPEREKASREEGGPLPMEIDYLPGHSAPTAEWQEAGPAAGQLLGSAPLKLDWTQPALPMRPDPSQLGFEDAFANLSEDAEIGGRNRRLSLKSRSTGDPESLRAEQLLAAGASAMQMGEAVTQKSRSGR